MNKKKAQEYLDKINQSFAELGDPAHEIDMESLLGYLRIFYSSVKAIPLHTYGLPVLDDPAAVIEPNKKETTDVHQMDQYADYYKKENNLEVRDNTKVSSNISIEEHLEAEATIWPESNSLEISEADDTSVRESREGSIEEVTPSIDVSAEQTINKEYIKTFEEEEEEEKQEVAHAAIEDKPEIQSEEPKVPVFETPSTEALQTNELHVEPIVQPEPIPTYQEIAVERTVPFVEPVVKSKETFLTKIEAEQSRPLYQPTGQNNHNPNDAIESLFREKSPTGLVDFLGLSSLDNLNKAWGLNEKMLVIKDLFDDDFASFNDTVEMINKFTSFEEVKYYLINNVVDKYKWNDLSRFKKASDFIVQTKRLFVK